MTANISIASPAATGTRDVSASNGTPGGGTGTLSNGFTVNNPAPTLSTISPSTGSRLQTLNLVLTGTNFISAVTSLNPGSNITVNSITVNSSAQLTANITISTAAGTGSRKFYITNTTPGGGTDSSQTFTVNNPAPTVSSISPSSGNRSQSFSVVSTGTNFISNVTTVNLGSDITLNSLTVNSSTQLTANITISSTTATGTRKFVVTNGSPGGGTDSSQTFTVNTGTAVHNVPDQIPTVYSLSQNYPNPFNPSTSIRYGVPSRSMVRLEIFNVLGQQIEELLNAEQEAGYHEVSWRTGIMSGVYFYRIQAVAVDNPQRRFVETKKLLLLR
jgi:hypothetical protein